MYRIPNHLQYLIAQLKFISNTFSIQKGGLINYQNESMIIVNQNQKIGSQIKQAMNTHNQQQVRLRWRIWQILNYLSASLCMIVASFFLYPSFQISIANKNVYSLWLFRAGFLCYCIKNYTQWMLYQQKIVYRINLLWVSFLGSAVYLIGSLLVVSQEAIVKQACIWLIVGSAAIFLSQGFKIGKAFVTERKDCFVNDSKRIIVNVCLIFNSVLFIVGCVHYLVNESKGKGKLSQVYSTKYFCIGSFFFYISCIFQMSRYFWKPKKDLGSIRIYQNQNKQQETSLQQIK